jgi:hypothetical protein
MPTAPAKPVEILPGDVWESQSDRHRGLRAEVIRDGGMRVKVRVLRSNFIDTHGMEGKHWQIPRDVLLKHWAPVRQAEIVKAKPRVETDFKKLLEAMPAPVVREAEASTRLDGDPQPWTGQTAAPAYPQQEQVKPLSVEEVIDKALAPARVAHALTPEGQTKRKATLQARVDALTPGQRDEIKARRESGESVFTLAHDYHLDVTAMGNLLAEMGIPTMKNGRVAAEYKRNLEGKTREQKISAATKDQLHSQFERLSTEEKAAIVSERLAGASYWGIMRKHKIINGVVTLVLREAGVATGKEWERQKYAMEHPVRGVGGRPKKNAETVSETRETPVTPMPEPVSIRPPAAHGSARYVAKVIVMKPVEQELPIDADNFDDALVLAKAYDGVIRVKSLSEA